ncbi:hypothetical protein NHX12_020460 [Muraenolepis orangiensis]|uniref:NADH dehydrogenase [ubiquinone] 1 alpha subcomplex subunit 5 n=1 Tax=Muraenolepis orangiensis TaxID=630683 RepID=A0A9Q0ERT1_9TELE|nr:hypothetical protein NHX12_020460 [Muraenolepis orangiensis]
MAGLLKKTTGLVGLAVATNPQEAMPADAAYRKYTEQLVSERFDLLKSEPDVATLEQKINGGQIEEVIFQAECELALSRKMVQWKPWEPLVEEPPPGQWKWPI